MKRFIYKPGVLAALFAGVLLTGCDPEIDTPAPVAGQVDFTKYVAIGNSLTAGYQDQGLYREGQLNSFPAILADQFKEVGGGEFVQPLFGTEEAGGSGYLKIEGFNDSGRPVIVPVPGEALREGTMLPGGPALTKYTDPVQNLGVPGISVLASASEQYGAINPYFERLLEPAEVGSKAYVQEVVESDPTFFTLWLGNMDALGYALAGGAPSNPLEGLTSPAIFSSIYNTLVNNLTADGSTKGLLATIPDVAAVPFFTTIPHNVLVLTSQQQVDALNQAYGNGAIGISFQLGPNALVVRDATSPAGVRQIKSTELVLLTASDSIAARGYGSLRPMPDRFFIDETELKEITDAVKAYNEVIQSAASSKNLAVFDANAFFRSIQGGFVKDGVAYSPAFVSGNLFSLDGVHPTPRGYAIIANEMIKAINAKYGASVPTVDETQYRAVLFP